MDLPKITAKQQALIRLLYQYRYLERSLVQDLLGHTDKRRISAWLKDLRQKHYIEWHYNRASFSAKSKPAIYYLGLNGIRYLRSLEEYPAEQLRRRYKDGSRQPDFMARCLLVANCCTMLQSQNTNSLPFYWETETDYSHPQSDYHFLTELRPSLCFSKQEAGRTNYYLLKIFDASAPRYVVRKRLQDYLAFAAYGDWERETGGPAPQLRFACPTTAELMYIKRRLRMLLEQEALAEKFNSKVTTIDLLTSQGITARIWEAL